MVTSIYFNIYKNQIIDNKIYSLNEYLNNSVIKAEYELSYAKSFLQHKIDSKEAALIFSKNEIGQRATAPYISQFLEQFIGKKVYSGNQFNVINDFIIFDKNQKLVVHINTVDPFADTQLQLQTQKLFNSINKHMVKKVQQYYYFIDQTDEKLLNIIQVFSPYMLNSQQVYSTTDDLYIIQAQVGLPLIRSAIDTLLKEHNGYITSVVTRDKDIITDEFTSTLSPFTLNNEHGYQAKIDTSLFSMVITLDDRYFAEDLNEVLTKLILLGLVLVALGYFVVFKLIDLQVILPITKLAKSIKEVEASMSVELKPLKTNDEVSELNESYISLIKKIHNLANNDSLTGLANRRSFNQALTVQFQYNYKNNNSTYTALYFIDLDNFKYVNDTCGHEVGDQLLVNFSERLSRLLNDNTMDILKQDIKSVARLGGDEFVVLLTGLTSITAIEQLAKKVCALFIDSFEIGVNKFNIHASVGVAYTKNKVKNGEEFLHQADSAMYLAKELGKNNYKLFTSEIEEKIKNEHKIEQQLIETLDNDKLVLVFMPAYTASDVSLKGYEVLLRCPDLTEVGVGPDIFIPIAEKTDLILKIDLWVAENAFIKLNELINETGFNGFFAINVSSKSLRNDDFYYRMKRLITYYKIDVKQIELEITETCLMPDDHQAIVSLNQLKSLGVRIAIDDFGTGYTSFNQLVNYPLDTLKIDRSFVQSLDETPIGKKPTLDIIYELAKIYELDVIVEGIETEANLKHVQKLPDVIVQGYYFSKPYQWEALVEECRQSVLV